jgi:hypothetical protein
MILAASKALLMPSTFTFVTSRGSIATFSPTMINAQFISRSIAYRFMAFRMSSISVFPRTKWNFLAYLSIDFRNQSGGGAISMETTPDISLSRSRYRHVLRPKSPLPPNTSTFMSYLLPDVTQR